MNALKLTHEQRLSESHIFHIFVKDFYDVEECFQCHNLHLQVKIFSKKPDVSKTQSKVGSITDHKPGKNRISIIILIHIIWEAVA